MITGYVLAGGRSSRMGRDKAFLELHGRPLIRSVIQRLRPHVDSLVVIGSERNRARLENLPVDAVVTDLQPDLGPLMGVYTGLMHSQTALSLFASCDMPWIAPAHVAQLIRAWRPGVPLVAGCDREAWLYPLPLLCHRELTREVGRLLDRGPRSLKSLLDVPGARLVPIEPAGLGRAVMNVNTPEEYARLTGAVHIADLPA